MTEIRFTVHGQPEEKGSTRSFAVPIKGSTSKHGGPKYRAVTTSANPDLKRWEQLVAFEAGHAARGQFLRGPIGVELVFRLRRPPSVSVKSRPWPTVRPDLDKLARGAIDALSGVLFDDDAQIVTLTVLKRYAGNGTPSLEARVAEITGPGE